MTVRDLISILDNFPDEWEVTITDGYQCKTSSPSKRAILPFEDLDGTQTVDIGIGGLEI